MFFCATVPAYAVGFFAPVLLMSMGFNIKESFLLIAPPSVAAVRPSSILHILIHQLTLVSILGHLLLLLRLAR